MTNAVITVIGEPEVGKKGLIGKLLENGPIRHPFFREIDIDVLFKPGMISPYRRKPQLFILCFDFLSKESYDNLQQWVDRLSNIKSPKSIILVGNNHPSDTIKHLQKVTDYQPISFAETQQVPYIVCQIGEDIDIERLGKEIYSHLDFLQNILTQQLNLECLARHLATYQAKRAFITSPNPSYFSRIYNWELTAAKIVIGNELYQSIQNGTNKHAAIVAALLNNASLAAENKSKRASFEKTLKAIADQFRDNDVFAMIRQKTDPYNIIGKNKPEDIDASALNLEDSVIDNLPEYLRPIARSVAAYKASRMVRATNPTHYFFQPNAELSSHKGYMAHYLLLDLNRIWVTNQNSNVTFCRDTLVTIEKYRLANQLAVMQSTKMGKSRGIGDFAKLLNRLEDTVLNHYMQTYEQADRDTLRAASPVSMEEAVPTISDGVVEPLPVPPVIPAANVNPNEGRDADAGSSVSSEDIQSQQEVIEPGDETTLQTFGGDQDEPVGLNPYYDYDPQSRDFEFV